MTDNPSRQVGLYAKVAVSSITFGIDRPYDYRIPRYCRPGKAGGSGNRPIREGQQKN